MNKQNVAYLMAGIVFGVMLLLGFRGCKPDKPNKPEIGGQEVPNTYFVIDFNKRYNLGYSQDKESRTFQNIKILGYTGAEVKESSGQMSSGYTFFNNWLVIERIDGRKVFVPTSGISFMEEISAPNN